MSQIRCGKARLSVQTLLVLCDILEVTPNYVLLADPSLAAQTPVTELLRGLTPQQLSDAEQILKFCAQLPCGKKQDIGFEHTAKRKKRMPGGLSNPPAFLYNKKTESMT